MRYLANLTSVQTSFGLPWTFAPSTPIPEKLKRDKKARDAWICNPSTRHCVYSAFEGVNENLRINNSNKKEDEGNPPHKCYGLIADYDSPVGEEELVSGCKRCDPHPPNYFERTLSGNSRFLWLFEEPVVIPSSFDFASFFLKEIQDKIKINTVSVGFDQKAFEDPARLYTNSGEWMKVSDAPLSKVLVQGWLVQISQKFNFKGDEFGVEIPLPIVADELAKKYPRFMEWPGTFDLGSQGGTFWIDQSTSPKSAIVRETGIQTFSAHAGKGFYNWADLLGAAFVEEYRSKMLGTAVAGIFHDGKNYYRTIGDKTSWKPFTKEDLILHLAVSRGLPKKPDKTGVSQIDRAIQYVQDFQSVLGAAPFVFQPAGLIYVNRQPVLNIHTRRVLPPSAQAGVWGPEGNFPYLSQFLDGFFHPKEPQLEFFLSWLHYFYKNGYQLTPRSGHNVFIAGSTGVGKTFLNRCIIGTLMGGCAEAKEYLLNEDKFGSELFEVAHWVVDDSSTTATFSTHKKFSEMIKRMAANRTFRYHAKFRVPTMVQWQGRVVNTCNRDAESIRQIPDLEIGILDKLMIFKSADEPGIKFHEDSEMDRVLSLELPFLARYLLDYQIPDQCLDKSDKGERFKLLPYAEPSLVSTAKQSSRYSGFREILEDFKQQYFSVEKEKEFWVGSAFQLHKAIHMDPSAATAMKAYPIDVMSRCLSMLQNKGEKIEGSDTDGPVRTWKIYRDEKLGIGAIDQVPFELNNRESKFQKV